MFYNYLLLAWRNLRRHATVSFINIFGISIAIATSITAFLFLKTYWSLDTFHEKGEHLYVVEYDRMRDGKSETWANAPEALAQALRQDFAQVEQVVCTQRESVTVLHKGELMGDLLMVADTNFFTVFSFPLQYGNAVALRDPNAIILSEQAAKRYFGDENPVGKLLVLYNDQRESLTYTVQGVVAPFPDNTGFRFSLLTGDHRVRTAAHAQDWAKYTDGLFVLLRPGTNPVALAAQWQRYIAPFNTANPEVAATRFVLDNLGHPNADAYNVYRRPSEASHPFITLIYGLIALIMMTLSCSNYVNIALGALSHRLREIGVRKAIGGSRRQVIMQFLTENLLLCSFALGVGILLTKTLFVPLQNQAIVIKTSSEWKDIGQIWWFLVGLLGFTALVSGIYPALYVARFNVTSIFSGKTQISTKSRLRKTLLCVQFGLAYLAVIVSIVLLNANQQFKARDWGYDPTHTIVFDLMDSTQYPILRNELLRKPTVRAVDGATQHIGREVLRSDLIVEGQTKEVICYEVGAHYAQTLGLPLKSGRFFHEDAGDEQSVVVNQTFADKMGWPAPLGKRLRRADREYVVVGLMEDVKVVPTSVPRPVAFFKAKPTQFNYLVAQCAPEQRKALGKEVEALFPRLFRGLPASYFFQNEAYELFDRSFLDSSRQVGGLALLALLLACMGLYGMATQHYNQRQKEVSIRKLLGASVGRILYLINRDFLWMLGLAGTIASIIMVFVVRLVVSQIRDYIGEFKTGFLPFIISFLVVLVAATLSVGRQSHRMTRVKLAETLKNAD